MNGKIKYFSMFTGVGGFELGIEQSNSSISQSENKLTKERRKWSSNESESLRHDLSYTTFSCVGFSEIDKYASQLLAAKFPEVRNYGDATKIKPRELPDFDMLCGGFPCQSFSIAGKRRGFEDTRGTMFFEVARILEVKRPKLVFLENVKGLLNHNKGETFKVILQTLEELGYAVQWMVLNSKFFGVPQNRERVFIIGNLRGEPRSEILPFRENNSEIAGLYGEQKKEANSLNATYARNQSDGQYVIHNIYGGFGEGIRTNEEISPTIRTPKSGGHLPMIAIPVLTQDRENKRQNGRRFKEEGDESFTLTKSDVHVVAIMDLYNNKEHLDRSPALTEPHHNTLRVREGIRIRRLTPIECERLQGFPDNYTEGFSDTQRYKMMGNAVTTNVIKSIMERLWKQKR
jgi:DNA (cytosine-5)-methyltransferase 1